MLCSRIVLLVGVFVLCVIPSLAESNSNKFLATMKAHAQEQAGCAKPKPMFCTNVDWTVKQDVIDDVAKYSKEMNIQMIFVNFKGSRQCKARFRDLQCRYAFPKCTKGAPCRSECEAFAQACPGAMQPCNAFPTSNCYLLPKSSVDSAAPLSASASPLVVVLLVAAVLSLMTLQ